MAETVIKGMVPVIGIRSYEEAVAHYVDWLGFNLDWEWREAPGKPVIMSISRDVASLMLNESGDPAPGAWLTLSVSDLEALAAEWNGRRPDSVSVVIGPPYDIPSLCITDPFGNRMDFQQPVGEAEEKARAERAVLMREHVRRELAEGKPCPAPEQLVRAIGPPIGMAMDVLCEFPEYGVEPD